MTLKLRPFQQKAISRLRKAFLTLWNKDGDQLPIIFKAPTGSGKTVMMVEFMRGLVGDPQFDGDKAYIWMTFSEDSYEQSKGKFAKQLGASGDLRLLDLDDLGNKRLAKNDVFFINWQKIKGTSKESRVLRRSGDGRVTFDDFVQNTHKTRREIILVIDEEHQGGHISLPLVQELLKLIKPKIRINVSATPMEDLPDEDIEKKRAFRITIDVDDVIDAGLIKERVVTQTKEDVERLKKKELDQDILLLELAYAKRLELKKHYQKLGVDINPLCLIQLPNDDRVTRAAGNQTKEEVVKSFLLGKGEAPEDIAVWLSEKDENLEALENHNATQNFLLFKQGAATGWDCPRAGVLVMFREIKTTRFKVQTIGRILRMPEGRHYAKPALNSGYLYTNYKRNEVTKESEGIGPNRPAIFQSRRKATVKPVELKSTYMSRIFYNDVGATFTESFNATADSFFGIVAGESAKSVAGKLAAAGVDLSTEPLVSGLIVDADIENYDRFVEELKEEGGRDVDARLSDSDVERMRDLLCFNAISRQEDRAARFAPERSWGKLKTALRLWFGSRLEIAESTALARIAARNLLDGGGTLHRCITEALKAYRPGRDEELKNKAARGQRQIEDVEVPPEELWFTDLKVVMDVGRSAMEPFYIGRDYLGKVNEKAFIEEVLEKHPAVLWWHKNSDRGSDYFAVPYEREEEFHGEALFYPDWIFTTKNAIWVIDTKAGDTADPEQYDTRQKAEALQLWARSTVAGKPIRAGIAVRDSRGRWRFSDHEHYHLDHMDDWQILSDELAG